MACFSATSVLLLLLALFSSDQVRARDSQFFNKVTTPTAEQQEPTFMPENENGYYGHESVQLPPSTTTTAEPQQSSTFPEEPVHKYLPKNYNPVAYVTEPEDDTASSISEATSLADNTFDGDNYQLQKYVPQYGNNNYHYSGGSSFNSDNRRRRENYYYNGGSSFRPQGMSDTRFLENGKYFYDLNTGKYSENHPYESLKGVGEYNDINSYGNRDTAVRGYQNQQQYEQFQDESSLP